MSCSRHFFFFSFLSWKQQEWWNERTCSHFAKKKNILVYKEKKTPTSSEYNLQHCMVFVGTFLCMCLSSCGIYFDTIRGSLHTPCRNQFSHSGPPVAIATSPWCWVTWKGYRGDSWCMHARTHARMHTQLHRGMFCRCWKLLNMSSSKCSLELF